mgnify:CR=1
MAIEVTRGSVTTRSYPRLMTHDLGALALITETGHGIYLDGNGAGKAFEMNPDKANEWEDFIGSVTLHNRD